MISDLEHTGQICPRRLQAELILETEICGELFFGKLLHSVTKH